MNRRSTDDLGGHETTLHETAMEDPCHCPLVQTHNSKSKPNVNYGLWVMMCPCRFNVLTNTQPGGES